MAVKEATAGRATARERLLAAANELFYDEGVQTVGIDRIIAQAGVAKASLYNPFGSKEELVRLSGLAPRQHGPANHAGHGKVDTPRERLLAVFEGQEELLDQAGYSGCAFLAPAPKPTPGTWSNRRPRPTVAGCARC